MKKVKRSDAVSFREQMAASMAELESIMALGQSADGDGRLTVRTVDVIEPGPYRAAAVRSLRRKLGVSQAVFAQLLGVSQVLVRSWERGARAPGAMARRLFDVIATHPEMVATLIRTQTSSNAPQLPHGRNVGRAVQRRRRASAA